MKKKERFQSWTHLTKLSGSAHVNLDPVKKMGHNRAAGEATFQ